MWALHDMLARAWPSGFRWIIIETDCLELSTWGRINSKETVTLPSPPSSLVAEVDKDKSSSLIDSLMPQDWFGNANAVCFNLQVDLGG
ncbi:hypothetical protein V6N11_045166 [Hibiscus sabdariffa]|uniref:RNase H type-1 domain-containing protein n=1 Tax=Hibiscus sabdariffa TaxID=183260 RepID=A0ABR1ZI77_9ROSI